MLVPTRTEPIAEEQNTDGDENAPAQEATEDTAE